VPRLQKLEASNTCHENLTSCFTEVN